MLVVFRADASPALGGGHIMRCLSLANELRRLGADCCFACASPTFATVPALASSGHRYLELTAPVDANELSKKVPGGCDWLVVDHYEWDASQQAQCRPWARRIMVIDDLADRAHDCDLLLDQTFGRQPSSYDGLISRECQPLIGSQYALLRPEFAMSREESLARRTDGRLERLIVSMGFTDPANATETVLRGILLSNLQLATRVVVGPRSPNLLRIRSLVERNSNIFELHVGTNLMADLMRDADLAFGASGSTAWERCCLGLPSVVMMTADNQQMIARALHRADAAICLGETPEVNSAGISKVLSELCLDSSRLIQLSRNAAAICDGLGATRAARAVIS